MKLTILELAMIASLRELEGMRWNRIVEILSACRGETISEWTVYNQAIERFPELRKDKK